AAMVSTLDHLGIERFEVRYADRNILNGLIDWAGIPPEQGHDVMRVLDKFERQGQEAVLLELGKGRTDDSGAKIPGLNLPARQIDRIGEFLNMAVAQADDPLAQAEKLLGDHGPAKEGIGELREIQSHLQAMGVSEDKARIDLTIVRGLAYYTGPVFETVLLDLPQYGSVFSGGRYDNLVGRFQAQHVPGTGSSIGIDRLLAALLELKAIDLQRATSQVLVTVMDRERLPEYLKILDELRIAGIRAEIFAGDTKNLTKQVRYGDRVGIPFAVMVGSEEFEADEITVKNLEAGASQAHETSDRDEWLKAEGFQERIKRKNLIPYLKKKLSL
ncbi:MAG: histidine--tRNA ligase family protein, partial [Candidatus Zixiibacteriota bacterium]